MVRFNVAQLLRSAPGTVKRADFSERIDVLADELTLTGPMRGEVKMTRTTQGVLAHVDYTAPVEVECSRCLEPVRVTIDGSFEEEFLPTTEIGGAFTLQHVPDEEVDEDQSWIDEHHDLDLDDMLRQEALTSLPVQPLCDTSCPGLCVECGERLSPGHPRHGDVVEAPLAEPENTPFAKLAHMLREHDADAR